MYVYVDIIYLIILHMHLCSVFIKISFHANTSLHTDYDRQLCIQAVDKYKEMQTTYTKLRLCVSG